MKTLLIVLLLAGTATAHELAKPPKWVDVVPWELTMVTRRDMIDEPKQFWTREFCIKEGIKRMADTVKRDDWEHAYRGFVCEEVRKR